MEKDLNELLEQFLGQPDSMEKIQGVLSSLGGGEPPAEKEAAPSLPDLSALQSVMPLLGGLGGKGESDRHVALLQALRPYLHDGREKRVDEAIDLLRLAKLLPLLTSK